jgi:CubicO group peptidase (beta-lactamase class C family)
MTRNGRACRIYVVKPMIVWSRYPIVSHAAFGAGQIMKYISFLIVLLLFIGYATSDFAEELSFEASATRHLSEVTKGESSGVAVLVARDGKVVFQGGFGLANITKKTPITPETKFRIGSVTKQFTAAAVLRLAEQGKLSLDDSLAKHFPDFAHFSGVTVRHLLTHTSGLHSYTEKQEMYSRVTKPIEPAALIALFQNDPPDFAPGAGFHYNNSAYFLLGELVAKVSGKSFADYLRESFFEPLGMKDTGIYVNSAPPPGMAIGYSFADDKFKPALDWDMSWAGGAGALYSTVGDLYRWNEALFGGLVVNEESFKAATKPVELPANVDGMIMKYGYGLMMYEIKRLPAIGHSGGLHGWLSDLVRLPKQHCTVVVLANAALPQPPELIPQAISHALVEKLLADEIKKLPSASEDKSVDPKTFTAYVGRYDYQAAIMTVSVEGDSLMAQLTGQPRHRIFAKAKDEFFWKVADAEVAFVRDEKGDVIAARHSQGGVTFTAKKLGEDAVKLTPDQLDSLLGQYQYGPGAVMTVSRDDTQLFAQLIGQPKFPIFPKSETEFEWRVVKATVEFVKGDDGKVTKAIHRQGKATIDAPRIK